MNLLRLNLLLLIMAGTPMLAQAMDGTMRFTGRVLAATCTLNTPNINVPLGKHTRTSLGGVGSTTQTVFFQIGLNCDKGARITVTLNGTQDPSNVVGVLALNVARGSATGVGVQILEGNGNPRPLNQPWVLGTTSATGFSGISMYGRYYQTASRVSAGTANATLQFSLSYQ